MCLIVLFFFLERSRDPSVKKRTLSLSNIGAGTGERPKREGESKRRERNEAPRFRKRSRKRRSFMETEYTSLVTFPERDRTQNYNQIPNHRLGPSLLGEDCHGGPSNQNFCPTVEGEPAQMESKPITSSKPSGSGNLRLLHSNKISNASQQKQQVILMEPDSMEFKSVTGIQSAASPTIVAVRTSMEPKVKVNAISSADGLKEEGAGGGMVEGLLDGHLFFGTPSRDCGEDALLKEMNHHGSLRQGPFQEPWPRTKSTSLPHLDQTPACSLLPLKVLTSSSTQSLGIDRPDVEGLDIRKCLLEPTERRRSQSMSAVSDRSGLLCLKRHSFPQMEPKDLHFSNKDSSGDPFTKEPFASTLRGKIQSVPLVLSRSQEVPASNSSLADYAEPGGRFSEDLATTRAKSDEGKEEVEQFGEVVCDDSYVEIVLKAEAEKLSCPPKSSSSLKPVDPLSLVVTTQNINGPWGIVTSQEIGNIQAGSSPVVVTHVQALTNSECLPTHTQPQALPGPNLHTKPELTCSSVLASVCETVIESAETPMEVCGCQSAYTNCFSTVLKSASFDDELTVYEFSCRTHQGIHDRVALVTSIPPSSLSGSSSSFSPSSPLPAFSRVVLPPSSATELGPLLSPLDTPDCFLSDPQGDAITALLAQHYSLPPTGFLALHRDVDTLLTVFNGAVKDQDCIQEHPRDTCAGHFSENKRRLHVEARGFLAGCQQVVKSGQTPAETLQALSDSFRSLVQLTALCLSFSSCQRCQERHTQTLLGLADVAQTYQEFARAAERLGMATERRTCHELSIKLLARQCTALTTSVFCLMQLFRTLTAL